MSDCSRLITFSKQIDALGGGSEIACPSACECDNVRLFTVEQRVTIGMRGSWCDETVAEFPDGSKLEAEITHHLRLPSACGAWIGYHEGRFQIVGDGSQIVDGTMRGTHGLDLRQSSNDLCCQYMHGEGIMLAESKSIATRLDGCRFVANYRTTQEMGPESDPCDPLAWRYWGMTISGILICPCV
jgi:hypothetical protein